MSIARSPLMRLMYDGAVIPGLLGADVFSSSHLSANRFRVRLSAQLVSDWMPRLMIPESRLTLEGSAVAPDEAPAWTALIIGQADSIVLDPIRGTVEIEGRDLAGRFIEVQAGEIYANQTASEIVTSVSSKHGITADVVETGTPIGRYYQDQHERLTLAQQARATNEWDLLTWLAGQEGYLLAMQGDRLRFAPRDQQAVPVLLSDCIALETVLQVGLLRPIEVTVRSWGTRAGQLITETARSDGTGSLLSQVVARPNLSSDQAQSLAQRVLSDLRSHARAVRLVMPGEFAIQSLGMVTLSGVGEGWDGPYAVGTLDRHLDATHGFTQVIELQNLVSNHG